VLCFYKSLKSKKVIQFFLSGEKPFVCEICGTRFSQKTYLKQHNELHHPKEEIKKEHKCDTCGKFFRLKGQVG
jgi:uncharacterized Zn-finger protein